MKSLEHCNNRTAEVTQTSPPGRAAPRSALVRGKSFQILAGTDQWRAAVETLTSFVLEVLGVFPHEGDPEICEDSRGAEMLVSDKVDSGRDLLDVVALGRWWRRHAPTARSANEGRITQTSSLT